MRGLNQWLSPLAFFLSLISLTGGNPVIILLISLGYSSIKKGHPGRGGIVKFWMLYGIIIYTKMALLITQQGGVNG